MKTPSHWALLKRELLQRRLPHGLLGWRYLWPGRDARIRAHRSCWWASGARWPRPLWMMLEGWHWLRWVGYSAWLASWRMDRAQRRNNALENWPPGSGWRVLRLALAWCIPPRDSVRFGLHRRPEAALDYVFDQELGGWHRLCSLPLGLSRASLALLQDKPRLSEALGAAGIPMAPILAVVARETPERPLSSFLRDATPVFCKMRSGNQGRGAFAAWRVGDGWAGRTFIGQPLENSQAVEQAWQALLQLDDALIQPRLDNHPALAGLGLAGEAITVRYISEWRVNGLACLSAVLEVPTHRAERSGETGYTILPVEAGTGRLLPWPDPDKLPAEARERAERLYRMALDRSLTRLPCWDELARRTLRAHAVFPDISDIAWDWVITPTGPVLLEGNGGWGAAMPQLIGGGVLCEGGPK
jgi:hypothetical protein